MNEFIDKAKTKVRVPDFRKGTTANEIIKLLLKQPIGRKELLQHCTKLDCEKHSTRGRISELKTLGIIEEKIFLTKDFLQIFKSKDPKKAYLQFIKNKKLRKGRN